MNIDFKYEIGQVAYDISGLAYIIIDKKRLYNENVYTVSYLGKDMEVEEENLYSQADLRQATKKNLTFIIQDVLPMINQ